MDKLNIVVDEMERIIKDSKKGQTYMFGIKEVEVFIDLAKEAIYNEVKSWL